MAQQIRESLTEMGRKQLRGETVQFTVCCGNEEIEVEIKRPRVEEMPFQAAEMPFQAAEMPAETRKRDGEMPCLERLSVNDHKDKKPRNVCFMGGARAGGELPLSNLEFLFAWLEACTKNERTEEVNALIQELVAMADAVSAFRSAIARYQHVDLLSKYAKNHDGVVQALAARNSCKEVVASCLERLRAFLHHPPAVPPPSRTDF